MFAGFKHVQLQTSDPQVTINLRYGGTGPGLLLLHGNPLTHGVEVKYKTLYTLVRMRFKAKLKVARPTHAKKP
jgi:hypothetical protein